jgi:hypothetical protein
MVTVHTHCRALPYLFKLPSDMAISSGFWNLNRDARRQYQTLIGPTISPSSLLELLDWPMTRCPIIFSFLEIILQICGIFMSRRRVRYKFLAKL